MLLVRGFSLNTLTHRNIYNVSKYINSLELVCAANNYVDRGSVEKFRRRWADCSPDTTLIDIYALWWNSSTDKSNSTTNSSAASFQISIPIAFDGIMSPP